MSSWSLTRFLNYCFLLFYSMDLFSWIIDVGPVHPTVFFFCALVVSALGLVFRQEWGRSLMVKLNALGVLLLIGYVWVSRICDWVTLNMAVNFVAGFFIYRSRFVRPFFSSRAGVPDPSGP